MNDRQIKIHNKKHALCMIGLLAALLSASGLFAWWMAERTDREMRTGMLQLTRIVAQAIDIDHINTLSGTDADLNSINYLRIKEQLAQIRQSNTVCRFIYLLGRKSDGRIFIYVDSEPSDSKDYSPPGQIYDEASEGSRRAFLSKTGEIEGPITDRWGTWVSGLIPMIDPKTGAVAAVLGMDIEASKWKMEVLARASLPISLMIILLIGIVTAFIVTNRSLNASPRPVMRRLLPPLAGVVVFLIVAAGAILWQQHRQYLTRQIKSDISDVSVNFHSALKKQATDLLTAIQPIATDINVKKALRKGDSEQLLADWRPVFETLSSTQFYFFDKERVCLLRVHNPKNRGDIVNHFPVIESERTGKTASGIELGKHGMFTLRVVQPVSESDDIIGYVELGKEIGTILQSLYIRPGIQIAVIIHKENLNRKDWEDGMFKLERKFDWDQLSGSVVIYASQRPTPDAIAFWPDQPSKADSHNGKEKEITFNGTDWLISSFPLPDATGKEIGDLLIIRDVTAENADFSRLLILGGSSAVILLVLLLSFVYILLRRTDSDIRNHQTLLLESEQSYHNQFANNSVIMLLFDPSDGSIIDVNSAALSFYGYSRELLLNMHITDINTSPSAEVMLAIASVSAAHGKQFQFKHRIADGSIRDVEVSVSSIKFGGRTILHSIIYDITERKNAEETLHLQQIELEMQNNELHRAQAELDTARARYFALYDLAPVGYCTISESGLIKEANLTSASMLGTSRDALVKQPIDRFILKEDQDIYYLHLKQLIGTGRQQTCELRMIKIDGTSFWVLLDINTARNTDGTSMYRVVLNDITEIKLSEKYHEMGKEMLSILNEPGELRNLIQRVISTLKTRTEFDAVGIRLQNGDDFPYFAQEGFPEDFLLTENSILECAANGEVRKDKEGKVILECTCGLIISGKTDPANPLFTHSGSFWVNNSLALLNIPPSEDPRLHPRNKCIYQGYASVALVPIRNNDRIIGLIQLNARRKECFTLDSIKRIEDIATHIGAALMRKQAEEALQAKAALLDAQTNASLDGILIVGENQKIILINHRIIEMFNVPLNIMDNSDDTLLLKHVVGLTKYPEQFLEKVICLYDHTGEISRDEIEFNNGMILDRYSAPVLDKTGKYYGRIWTFHDITENKQAEQKIKASENRYRMLFDKMAEGLALHEIICNENGKPVDYRFLDVNSAFEEMTGLKKEMLIGKTLLEVLPGSEQFWIDQYGKIALTGIPNTFEHYSKELSKYFLVTGYCPQSGQFATLIADITERKLMLLRLEKQLTREKVISSILSKLVKGVNYDEAIPYSLSAICRMLPVSRCYISIFGNDMEVIYNWSTDNTHLNSNTLISKLPEVSANLRKGKPIIVPYSIIVPTEIGVSLLIPMNIGSGKLGLLGFEKSDSAVWDDEDIRWLKTGASLLETVFLLKESKQELEFRQQLLIQADKMVSLGILVAGVAHEINNPNNAIMLNVPILQKIMDKTIPFLNEKEKTTGDFNILGMAYSELKGEIPLLFAGVMESSNRIKAIVEGLKEYARENVPETREDIKISRIIDSSLSLLSYMTKQTAENISINYQENIPIIRGNFQQIEQVFINLIQNACESSPGKKIKLKIETEYDSKAGKVIIKVIDNGRGISEKNLKHLTDPFFTTKRNSGGTGLGLSISASIIKTHKGELTFESQEGAGTTAIVTLPVAMTDPDKWNAEGNNL